MAYTLAQLIEGRGEPVHVLCGDTIRYALKLMIENDFSQLPVVDTQGRLVGMVSEQSIVRMHYYLGDYKTFLDFTVDNVAPPVRPLSRDDELSDALERLETAYAVVITEQNKPIGIVTHADTTKFLQQLSEGWILIEEIERTLREHIERAFPDSDKRERAIRVTVPRASAESGKPVTSVQDLTLNEEIELICSQKYWPVFEAILKPQPLFYRLLGSVRDIRNQLMHFRASGGLEADQRARLYQVSVWLAKRPKWQQLLGAGTVIEEAIVLPDDVVGEASEPLALTTGSKYTPLEEWLRAQAESDTDVMTMSFEQIEALLHDSLPPSARRYRTWWANDIATHPQARAWMLAGWKAENLDPATETVTFVRAKKTAMQSFSAGVLDVLKTTRPDIAQVAKIPPRWIAVPSRLSACYFYAAFTRGSLLVEFILESNDRERNKSVYDTLIAQRETIEATIGRSLIWERLDEKISSHIFVTAPYKLSDSPKNLDEAQHWVAGMLVKFVDAFTPPVASLVEQTQLL